MHADFNKRHEVSPLTSLSLVVRSIHENVSSKVFSARKQKKKKEKAIYDCMWLAAPVII